MSLSDLLTEIDKQTEENCLIQDQISKAQKELINLQFGYENTSVYGYIDPKYDDLISQLSFENREVLKQTQDNVKKLYEESQNLEDEISTAIEKLNTALDIQNNYQKELIQLTKSRNIYSVSSKLLQEEVSINEIHLADIENYINSANKQISATNTSLANQIALEESIETRGGGKIDTQNQIENLGTEIAQVLANTDKQVQDMMEVQTWIADDEEFYNKEMEKFERLYGFKAMHQEIQRETIATNRAIATNKREIENIEKRIHIAEKRYKILSKLPKKNLTEDELEQQTSNSDGNISSYYKQLNQLRNSSNQSDDDILKELENVRKEIKRLEHRVELAKIGLNASQNTMVSLSMAQKSSIDDWKKQNAENEEKYIKTINQIKTKIPVRTPKKSPKPNKQRQTPK